MKPLCAAAPPRTHARPDDSAGGASYPQGQRHPDRQRSVEHPAQNSPRRRDRDRSALTATIATKRHHHLLRHSGTRQWTQQ